ncbi:unnamed protein product [Ambrosiozyma monospora]|uniref:Unnamed protein product n=1 Tax=Ambrosiozyma monospora TaxID=43982 RepID=A0A9W7DMS6_AMBMO|nr:unnamed protein product [Ambrosiozyma monospora]
MSFTMKQYEMEKDTNPNSINEDTIKKITSRDRLLGYLLYYGIGHVVSLSLSARQPKFLVHLGDNVNAVMGHMSA